MDAAQLRACRNYYVQLLKNLAADDGAQSHASRLRAHVCQRTGIRGRASSRGATLDVCLRGIRGCGVENPQGFGIDERRFNATVFEK
ncbi:MAG: hypothetical protein V1854_07885 [Methanobacteriota archaeon]